MNIHFIKTFNYEETQESNKTIPEPNQLTITALIFHHLLILETLCNPAYRKLHGRTFNNIIKQPQTPRRWGNSIQPTLWME
jgi:hypothetical protein